LFINTGFVKKLTNVINLEITKLLTLYLVRGYDGRKGPSIIYYIRIIMTI
jgi:hypothetical protein